MCSDTGGMITQGLMSYTVITFLLPVAGGLLSEDKGMWIIYLVHMLSFGLSFLASPQDFE